MAGVIGRYQIHCILVKQRFRNQVNDCKSYPGADIDSGHNPVIIKRILKFKITKKVTKTDKFNTGKLQDKETRKLFQNPVRDELIRGHPHTTWTIVHHFLTPSLCSVHADIFYENIDISVYFSQI